ncbi:alpha/beta hydrolase [Fusibacter paucivorans]|uniref:Alpha/beta hydrolase n=1 Tax=Fusibacter paucivorans TaxID=76009 RepID=A0ABS5PV64_9FIRM|nr:alpha/beta hydrolase [Fusibacter paucivorans]MBS7527987.1 alpha/beta hydrolase [Fusibacter paucivorans]
MAYFATEDFTKLYYEVVGAGDPLVFIHGWSCSTKTFAPVVKELRKQYQCISYDHRGHGASSAPKGGFTIDQLGRDLNALLDYLGLEKVVLIGHSMGAATIYSYVKQFGCDRLKKVVLMDMSPKLVNEGDWDAGLLCGAYKMSDYLSDMELMSMSLSDFMWRFWKLVLPDFGALPEELKELVAPGLVGVNDHQALICFWNSMMYNDYREDIKAITVPVSYFLPDNPLYSIKTAEFIKANASAPVEIVTFENSTHMIQEEHVEKTIAEIDRFVKM